MLSQLRFVSRLGRLRSYILSVVKTLTMIFELIFWQSSFQKQVKRGLTMKMPPRTFSKMCLLWSQQIYVLYSTTTMIMYAVSEYSKAIIIKQGFPYPAMIILVPGYYYVLSRLNMCIRIPTCILDSRHHLTLFLKRGSGL